LLFIIHRENTEKLEKADPYKKNAEHSFKEYLILISAINRSVIMRMIFMRMTISYGKKYEV
jgi:hypothetical protein